MKKIYSLVVVLAATLSANAQTTEVTVTKAFADLGFQNEDEFPSGNIDNLISFTTQQNGSTVTPKFFTAGNTIRLYPGAGNGGSITFNLANGVIVTNFSITADEYQGTSYAQPVTYTVNNGTAVSATATNNVYSIGGLNATNSIVFKNANTNTSAPANQLRITGVTFTYTVDTASTIENNIEGLQVYPNPAKELVNIISNEIGTKNVSIYNMLGKKVLETSTEETVNVSSLTSGVYIMKISQDGKSASRKLVIK